MPLTLTRRGRIWYVRGTVRKIRIYESTGVCERAAAEEIRAKREARLLEQSIHGEKATIKFFEAVASYGEAGGSPRFLGRILQRFAHRKMSTLTQADLDAAARALHPGAAAETLNRQVYTPFIAVWNHAAGNGWAEVRKWRRPRKAKGTAALPRARRAGTRAVDYERAARFVLAMSPAPAMVMTTLFYTGMRPIELFALDASDVDVAGRWLVVRSSKTGEPRGVPIHSMLVPMLTALAERGGPMFRTPRGEPYPLTEDTGGQIKSAIRGARARTGIGGISPYTARHTVSTQLVIAGVHPHIKDQILGHAVDDMSRHYTHVPRAPLIEAIERLPVVSEWAAAPWLREPLAWERKLVKWGEIRKEREVG